jgi:hypothetical protein
MIEVLMWATAATVSVLIGIQAHSYFESKRRDDFMDEYMIVYPDLNTYPEYEEC